MSKLLTKEGYLLNKKKYEIIGYKGKQVRDNLHSHDVVSAVWEIIKKPRKGEIYNLGGGLKNSCSILEIIKHLKDKYNIDAKTIYKKTPRIGDHQWYATDNSKFKNHYSNWKIKFSLNKIIFDILKSDDYK